MLKKITGNRTQGRHNLKMAKVRGLQAKFNYKAGNIYCLSKSNGTKYIRYNYLSTPVKQFFEFNI